MVVNTNIYINECFQPKLLPFIHKHNGDLHYLFWPDLAAAHYSNETVTWIEENEDLVEKSSNPPNVPQARPILEFVGYFGTESL